jgi:hypothetical protein
MIVTYLHTGAKHLYEAFDRLDHIVVVGFIMPRPKVQNLFVHCLLEIFSSSFHSISPKNQLILIYTAKSFVNLNWS